MDKEKFIWEFKDQFVDAGEIELVSDTKFREIGSFDSLTGMAIIVMIKDAYGVDISEAEFRSCSTAGDVFNLVETKNG